LKGGLIPRGSEAVGDLKKEGEVSKLGEILRRYVVAKIVAGDPGGRGIFKKITAERKEKDAREKEKEKSVSQEQYLLAPVLKVPFPETKLRYSHVPELRFQEKTDCRIRLKGRTSCEGSG